MTKKNKYLFLLPTDSIGGAERVAMNLVSFLSNNKSNHIDIYILSKGNNSNWNKLSEKENIRIIFNKANSELSSLPTFLLWALKSKTKYDVCYSTHLHVNALTAFTRLIMLLSADKHIVRESTIIFDRFFGFRRFLFKFMYLFYFNVDLVICQTAYMKARLLEEVKFLAKKNVEVFRNPLDIHAIDNYTRNKLNVMANTPLGVTKILYVGRLIKLKNLPLLLNSLYRCRNNGFEFQLTVLGQGEELDSLIKLVRKLNLETCVTFKGAVANPYKYMADADIGVVTSIKEGFPNVIIEMMASGTKSVITTPCAGDLDTLPGLKLLSSWSEEELALELESTITQCVDNRKLYREFAESIDVNHFWDSIKGKK